MTVPEAAIETGLSRGMLYKLIKAGDIAHVRYERQIRVDIADIATWVKGQKTRDYKPARRHNPDLVAARMKRKKW